MAADKPSAASKLNVELAPNVTLGEGATIAGVCDHDWRLNPAVCTTTVAGDDAELWTCAKCKTQTAGPLLKPWLVSNNPAVRPFDPSTWERRHA